MRDRAVRKLLTSVIDINYSVLYKLLEQFRRLADIYVSCMVDAALRSHLMPSRLSRGRRAASSTHHKGQDLGEVTIAGGESYLGCELPAPNVEHHSHIS